jgi:hypothetical protein
VVMIMLEATGGHESVTMREDWRRAVPCAKEARRGVTVHDNEEEGGARRQGEKEDGVVQARNGVPHDEGGAEWRRQGVVRR